MLRIVLAVVIAMSALAFTACGDKDKGDDDPVTDTFYKGTVSVETYNGAEAAAEGFLNNEVAGEGTQVTFKSYTKKADLTEEEIDKLAIDDGTKKELTAVEKGEVEYDASTPESVMTYAVTEVKTKRMTIYILTLGSDYKYFAPALQKGDPVTKTYFETVTDLAHFNNVTVVSQSVTKTKIQGMTVTYTMTMDIKIAGKYCWAKNSYVAEMLGQKEDMSGILPWTEAFFVFEENFTNAGTTLVYLKGVNGSTVWQGPTDSAIDMAEQLTQQFDYTYYIKTGGGFKLSDEKFSLYMQQQLEQIENVDTSAPVTGTSTFYVGDGKLSKSVTTLNYKMIAQGQKYDANLVSTETYSAYGTTTVTVPEGITLPSDEPSDEEVAA